MTTSMKSIREQVEHDEVERLAPAAARSIQAQRPVAEERCDFRTDYQRDRDRIIHCRSFRRLKSKTQVFLPPSGDHVRTRLTHTLEVTQIARTIARSLRLNEDLTEAIGLGHDLGHTPFGHAGERALAEVFPGFRHNEQSLRVVDHLEKDGRGLNLTNDTRDGILRHSKPVEHMAGEMAGQPATAEAQVVKIADAIAYINHDLEDAIRARMLSPDDIPQIAIARLGERHSQRINTLVESVIFQSRPLVNEPVNGRQVIQIAPEILEAANALRRYLFERVYDPINRLPSTQQAARIVRELFRHYVENSEQLPPAVDDTDSIERRAADLIAGMTDQHAIRTHQRLFMPGFEEV